MVVELHQRPPISYKLQRRQVEDKDTLGVYLYTFFSFDIHCIQVDNRVSNILKALASTHWGEQNETLLMTYKALGRLIANYAVPVWITNGHDTARSERSIITGSQNMSSIDHIHSEIQSATLAQCGERSLSERTAQVLFPVRPDKTYTVFC